MGGFGSLLRKKKWFRDFDVMKAKLTHNHNLSQLPLKYSMTGIFDEK